MNIFATTVKHIILMALSMSLLTGCMSFNPRSMRLMETALIESNPDLVIESSTRFGLGGLTLDLVDFAFVHDRSIDVSKISRAEIGIYELNGTLVFDDFRMPQTDANDRKCPRRDVIVQVREDDEHMRITACIRGEKVTGLSMFMLEPGEIVVVNLRGNFEALVNSLVKASVKKKSHRYEAETGNGHSRTPTVANQRIDGIQPPS